MNNVVLIGRLTRDPESSNIGVEGKTAISKFTVAVDRDGKKDETDFIRITTFGKQAETCDKYLSKGRQVAVLGRIQTGNYKDKEGNTVYTTDVIANRIEFLGSPSNGGQKTDAGESASSSGSAPVDAADEVATDVPF